MSVWSTIVCSTRVFCSIWWRLWQVGGFGVCFNSFCSYSAFCNSFDAIMFTALLFSILVFVWAAHCRSGQFWAGLGGSEQVFAAHVMSRICFLHKNLVHMCLPINCLHHKCLPHTYFLHKCLTCVVVGLVAVLQ